MTIRPLGSDRAQPLPESAVRLLVYVLYDRRGGVEEYVLHALRALREHAQHILVVVNGALTDDARAQLSEVADDILLRANEGLDIAAHRDALLHLGERIAEYDEVILANDTWYGPVRPFAPVFDRMDALPLDFWGMTDHGEQDPNPFTGEGVLERHLQSYWIAVRRRVLQSHAWRDYWRELPALSTYEDAVLLHEARFTPYLVEQGFVAGVAFEATAYPTDNPSLFNADLLLEDGAPTLKRRPFFHWPPYLDHHAVIGRWTLEKAAEFGFPMSLIWRDLARNVRPKDLNADAGLLEVLAPSGRAYDASRPLRLAVIAHIYYPEMTSELLSYTQNLPSGYDLVVTTSDSERAASISEILDTAAFPGERRQVRVLDSNDGRDQSALLIGCRDILLSDEYDLVVKIHSKHSPQDGHNVGLHFRTHQLSNMLDSPGIAASMLALFQDNDDLGIVFPPMIHVGYPTLGRGWATNKSAFAEWCRRLGIFVPLDDISPLAPYGSMYVARPRALRLLAEHPWSYEDFASGSGYRDGGLAHVLERMPAYAAGEQALHTRTVITPEYMSVSHTSLDFKLDQMSATLPGYTDEQIEFLRRAGFLGDGRAADMARAYVRLHHPERADQIEPWLTLHPIATARHWLWRAVRPKTWRRGWSTTDR